jgi:transcription-repair coupling factor (superfamily II helicase)
MNLSGLLPLIEEALDGERMSRLLHSGKRAPSGPLIVGVPDGAKAALIALLAQRTMPTGRQADAPLVVVTSRSNRALALVEELAAWLGSDERLHLFPRRAALPYERIAPDADAVRDRLRVLALLAGRYDVPPVIVAPVQALAEATLSPEEMTSSIETLTAGGRLAPQPFLRRLAERGYQFSPLVDTPGQAGRRGGIIDVFPPENDLPVRIELLGERIESLRLFNPDTQRTVRLVESVVVGPAREMLLPQPGAADLLAKLDFDDCKPDVAARYRDEMALVVKGESFPDDIFYVPFLASCSLLDFLAPDSLLVLDELADIAAAEEEHDQQVVEIRDEMTARCELPKGLPFPQKPWPDLREALTAHRSLVDLSRWASGEEGEGSVRLPFAAASAYGGRLLDLTNDLAGASERRQTTVVVSQQAARIAEVLSEHDLFTTPLSSVESPLPAGALAVVHGSLPEGWSIRSDGRSLTLLTDAELFGFVKQRRFTRPPAGRRVDFLADISPGDFVVHIEHGIAQFAGLTHLGSGGQAMPTGRQEREYLELRYAEGDRLFVPTDQVDRVSRYVGPGDQRPTLTRLGTQEWRRAKDRVKRAVRHLARELLALYAARQVLEGHAFTPDAPWQQELEASFPYVETPDQAAAMLEVKEDMGSIRPMDRLVCGDVGYGKTEIAIRAAFKAVMDGMQVAMLVPTTVLAQQHYQTFCERLAGFPVRVEMLSRFRSDREQRDVVRDLAAGPVDIVIGTHRLLQRDVGFHNLGLVVIDEEQRFGVAHKERLKQMRQQVDVLTLSATPIPRTLHMALGGIRDMSVMDTPPEDRLPIKTYVLELDDHIAREAILRELERKGQVYFVHNRVYNIEAIAEKVRRLVPEAEVAVAHGQMPEDQLERVMLDFARGAIDVLVCTTIIESGLDIPNVNTIIINQADRLGLAQLYQLRGRVGRGASRAYAYLFYDRHHSLTEPAQKRLQAIFEATELGAGFQIALRDLEIRGAGNLLGSEQSGHVGAVGFDLYTRLLADAVEELKALQRGEKPPVPSTALPPLAIDLPLVAHIPESYAPDLNLRLALYQRMTRVQHPQEADDMAQELRDRFGPLPEPVQTLLYVVRLRALARETGVQSIQTEDGQIVLRMTHGHRLPQERLRRQLSDAAWVGPTSVRLSPARLREGWRDALLRVMEGLVEPTAVAPLE